MIVIPAPENFTSWRETARDLLANRFSPKEVLWQGSQGIEELLFAPTASPPPERPDSARPHKVPAELIDLAKTTACHRSGEQWPLLYSLLWRITHGEHHLLKISSDPEVHRVQAMVKAIRRDCHKMHAFVRFRKVGHQPENNREQFVAWFEPDHKIIRLNASFFRKRFTNMDWSILTPDECMHWDGKTIRFTPGADQSSAPTGDELEELWISYYRSIFNSARVKTKAMQSEMPKKYWKNLPEAAVIPELLAESHERVTDMLAQAPSPEKPAPQNTYLDHLKELPEGPDE